MLLFQKTSMQNPLYSVPYQEVYSVSYSSRSLHAHFLVHSTLSAGLVTVLFLQKSLMHNPLFRASIPSVLFLPYSSRTFQCPFPCVQGPLNMSSSCPITLEVFLAHSTVQSALPEGILSFLFLGKFSMHIPLYRLPYQQV